MVDKTYDVQIGGDEMTEGQAASGVSLNPPTETPSTGISLPPPMTPTYAPSPAIASKRTEMTDYGSSGLLKQSKADTYQDYINGREQSLREQLSSTVDKNRAELENDRILQVAKNSPNGLTWDQIKAARDPWKASTPSTVVENAFAVKFIDETVPASARMAAPLLNEAKQLIPEQVQQKQEAATDLATKKLFFQTMIEDLEQAVEKQGTFSWLVDQAKSATQIYPEAKLRGLVEGVGYIDGGLGLGTNLREQSNALIMQPLDEMQKNAKAVADKLRKDNPSLALDWARHMLGVSTSDETMNNLFTLMAVPDFFAGAKATKSLIRMVDVNNRANILYKDMVKAAGEPGPVKAVAAEATGDAVEGAVQRVTTTTLEGNPKPIDNVIASLPDSQNLFTHMEDQISNIQARPAPISREWAVRLQDGLTASAEKMQQALDYAIRVMRTPLAVTVEDAVRAMKEQLKDTYPGIRNSIMNISDPIWHQLTNTYHATITLGNIGGELFRNIETAQGFIKLHGLGDAKIVQTEGILTNKGMEKALGRQAELEHLIQWRNDSVAANKKRASDKALTAEERKKAAYQARELPKQVKKDEAELALIKERIGHETSGESTAIRQQGLGYHIVISKPLNETTDAFREYAIKLGAQAKTYDKANTSAALEGRIPDEQKGGNVHSWLNAAIGKLRGADDTLSLMETTNRKIATYARKVIEEAADHAGKEIEQIMTGKIRFDPVTGEPLPWWKKVPMTIYNRLVKTKEQAEQFQAALRQAKDEPHPITGVPGYSFKTPGELKDYYLRVNQREPTFAEQSAYFSHWQLYEYDRILREVAEFRNRSRLGTEQHSIAMLDAAGKTIKSDYFDGVNRTTLPKTNDSVVIFGARKGDEKLETLNVWSKTNAREFKMYQDGLKTGQYKLIDIFNPEFYPLAKFSDVVGGEHVRYALVRNSESKPLEFNHVARKDAGHYEYDYNQYIKQAKMIGSHNTGTNDKRAFVNMYMGDTTLMPIENNALGREIIKHMDQARLHIKNGEEGLAKQYLLDNKFPIEWDTFRSWFNPTTVDGVKHPPKLDLEEPFYLVKKNQKIFDIDKTLEKRYPTTWKDGTKSGSLGAQNQVAFNTQRDADGVYTITDRGTQSKPLYGYEPAETIDPIPSLNRALDRMVNSTFMDDYKTFALENWLREATPWLRESEESIKSTPYWNFHNATSKDAFKPSTPTPVLNSLLSNRYKIEQFLGVPSKFDTFVHSVTQALVDANYEKFGAEEGRNVLQKAITVPPLWVLSRLKDPVSLMRGFTFNAKLGLFAVPQILTQVQTYASIWAISPRNGLAGTYATMLHSWMRINSSPEFIEMMDKMATKMNFGGKKWAPGELTEARNLLKETGFEKVAGEFVAQDAVQHKFVGDVWGNFLRLGQVPFHEGERAVRLGAWYTAFRDFKDLNPGKIIGNAEKAEILNRADLLSNNMSRASNSMLHGGVLSLTTQFLSYQLRLAELFWGRRLGETVAERNLARARMVSVYSALYGVPGALGLSGLPLGDDARQEYINRGYVPGKNWTETALMEGLTSTLLALSTGNFYNVSGKLGVQGFTQAQDIFRSDYPILKLVGGASVSTLANTITAGDGFLRSMASMIRGDQGDMAYKMTPSVFVDMFKEVSSVNATWRMIAALNTGKWFTKGEGYVTDVTPLNAIFQTISGLSPLEQQDFFLKGNIMKAQQDYQKWALKQFITDFRRGAQEAGTNPELSKTYYANAFARLYQSGYPLEKRAAAVSIAAKGFESMIKSRDYDFYLKNPPTAGRTMFGLFDTAGKQAQRREAFKNTALINDGKK